MAKVLQLVGGIPKMVDVTVSLVYYDESILVNTDIGTSGIGYDSAHTLFTLPNAKTYNGLISQLQVFGNETAWEEGVHYTYQASVSATQITTLRAIPNGTRVRFVVLS